jgi:hypothetical protein
VWMSAWMLSNEDQALIREKKEGLHSSAGATQQRGLLAVGDESAPVYILRLPRLPVSPQEAQTHGQQTALQTAADDEDAPGTPAARAEAGSQTSSKDKAAWGLDAHHDDGEAARLLQAPGGDNLGDVLDGSERSGEQAEHVGPGAGVCGQGVDDDDGANEGDDEEGEGEGEDEDGFLPSGQGGVVDVGGIVGLGRVVFGGAREEDEEKEHAGGC